jgi:hypothetical protein
MDLIVFNIDAASVMFILRSWVYVADSMDNVDHHFVGTMES